MYWYINQHEASSAAIVWFWTQVQTWTLLNVNKVLSEVQAPTRTKHKVQSAVQVSTHFQMGLNVSEPLVFYPPNFFIFLVHMDKVFEKMGQWHWHFQNHKTSAMIPMHSDGDGSNHNSNGKNTK